MDAVEFQVNEYTALWQSEPAVANFPKGGFVVAWQSAGSFADDDDVTSIQVRRFDSAGRGLNEREEQVNVYSTLDQNRPAVATDLEGNFVVVWESWGSFGTDQEGYSIQTRRFSSVGEPLDGQEFQVNTYVHMSQQRAAVAASPEGDFVVVWDSWGSDGSDAIAYSVQARRFSATGEPKDPLDLQVNTYTTNSQFYSSVAMRPDGGFVVVWMSGESAQTDRGTIQARRFGADGIPLDATEFRVDTLNEGAVWRPVVASAPNGRFVVAWENLPPSGVGEYRLFGRRFEEDGTPLDAEELQLNAYTSGRRDLLSLATNVEGDFVASWSSFGGSQGGDTSLRGVQVRRFRADGTAIDAVEAQVNAYTTSWQQRPAVAVGPEGDFVVVWDSQGSYGDDDSYLSIQARRFGRPLIPVTSSEAPGCTLRDAVEAAVSGSPVAECPAGSGGGVIELPSDATIAIWEADDGVNGLPIVDRPVTVRGRGATIARDPGLACPVGPEFRLFEVADGGILTLEDVTVSNGCVSSGAGGGILVSGGTLVLRESEIAGNEADTGGGVSIRDGGLISFESVVRGNRSTGRGGGLELAGALEGMAIAGSSIEHNAAGSGGGISLAGSGRLLARNSTLSGNQASSGGGGIEIAHGGAMAMLEFSTVVDNGSPQGAGVFVDAGGVWLHGDLVGQNLGGLDCAASSGTVAASGLSFDVDGSCASLAGVGVTTVPSLELGPLRSNGGPTRTHLPEAASPALDAAPACASRTGARIGRDQRGYPRPTNDDGDDVAACDLGAVERGSVFLDGFETSDVRRWSATSP